jgi:hypothetical protein
LLGIAVVRAAEHGAAECLAHCGLAQVQETVAGREIRSAVSREQIFQVLERLQKESRAHAVTHHVQRSDACDVQRLNERAQIFVRVRVVCGALRGPVEYGMTRTWPVEQKWLDMSWKTSQSQELTESAQS